MSEFIEACTDCREKAIKVYNRMPYCSDCYDEMLATLCQRKTLLPDDRDEYNRPSKNNKTIKFRINKSR